MAFDNTDRLSIPESIISASSISSTEYNSRVKILKENYDSLVRDIHDPPEILKRMMEHIKRKNSSLLKRLADLADSNLSPKELLQEVEQDIVNLFEPLNQSLNEIGIETGWRLVETVPTTTVVGDVHGGDDTDTDSDTTLDGNVVGGHDTMITREHQDTSSHSVPNSLGYSSSLPVNGSINTPTTHSKNPNVSKYYGWRADPETMITIEHLLKNRDGCINEVNFLDADLRDSDVPGVCQGLRRQKNLSGFHINAKLFGQNSIESILDSLQSHDDLKRLTLKCFRCSENFVNKFILFLEKKRNLCHLALDQCEFPSTSWAKIGPAIGKFDYLEILALDDTLLGDEGAEKLCGALMKPSCLKELSLTRNEIADEGVLIVSYCLDANLHLEKFSLAGNQITDIGAEYLGNVAQKNRQPCTVNLADNQIGTTGASVVLRKWSGNKKHSFIFDNNQIMKTIEGTKHDISILRNKSGKSRICVLEKRICRGESFRIINLRGMGLKDADLQNLCSLLCAEGKLETLVLRDNFLSNGCLPMLAQLYHRCEKLEKVDIEENPSFDASLCDNFKQLKKIREGKISAPFFFKQEFWNMVRNSSERGIVFDNTEFSEHCIGILFQILEDEQVGKIQFKNIPLDSSCIRKIWKHAFVCPGGASTLILTNNSFEFTDHNTLAAIFENELIGDPTANMTTQHFNQELILSKLILTNNEITDDVIKSLSGSIFRSPLLTHLNLENNCIGEQGCINLIESECLSANGPLVSLSLAGNKIGHQGLAVLRNALIHSTKLKHLSLSNCAIAPAGMVYTADVLEKNKYIEYLDLSRNCINNIKKKDYVEFAKILERNTTLQSLILSNNGLTDDDFRSLAFHLTVDSKISKLDISGNKISSDGLRSIVEILKAQRILYIDISGDCSLNMGVDDLCKSCASGEVLPSYIGLRNPTINGDVALRVAESLSNGYAKRPKESQIDYEIVLDLSGNHIDKDTMRKLEEYQSLRCIFKKKTGFFGSPF